MRGIRAREPSVDAKDPSSPSFEEPCDTPMRVNNRINSPVNARLHSGSGSDGWLFRKPRIYSSSVENALKGAGCLSDKLAANAEVELAVAFS